MTDVANAVATEKNAFPPEPPEPPALTAKACRAAGQGWVSSRQRSWAPVVQSA